MSRDLQENEQQTFLHLHVIDFHNHLYYSQDKKTVLNQCRCVLVTFVHSFALGCKMGLFIFVSDNKFNIEQTERENVSLIK